jgi:SAM-dependent methyltransferase
LFRDAASMPYLHRDPRAPPDDAGAIAEIARLLRPGGILLGAVPSHFTELLYWRLSRGYWNTPGGHVRIYRPRALTARLARSGLDVTRVRYVHFIDSLVWLRFCLTDFLRPSKPASDFEAAVLIAVAAERTTPPWRTRLRTAIGSSRFIAAIDAVGALVGKSFDLRRPQARPRHASAGLCRSSRPELAKRSMVSRLSRKGPGLGPPCRRCIGDRDAPIPRRSARGRLL